MRRITKETTYTGKIKNIKQCGQCTKSSCYGCTNYVQGKAQHETASRVITLELLKAVGIVSLLAVFIILY